jgi:hypothetical protein
VIGDPAGDECGGHEGWDALAPREYEAWATWANDMARTHRQVRCPSCGLWKLWVPKGEKA